MNALTYTVVQPNPAETGAATFGCLPAANPHRQQVIDEEGRDRTPKPMLATPLLPAARLPGLGESFQAGGHGAYASAAATRESVAGADHAGDGEPARISASQSRRPCMLGSMAAMGGMVGKLPPDGPLTS